jgi:hypothetical protein
MVRHQRPHLGDRLTASRSPVDAGACGQTCRTAVVYARPASTITRGSSTRCSCSVCRRNASWVTEQGWPRLIEKWQHFRKICSSKVSRRWWVRSRPAFQAKFSARPRPRVSRRCRGVVVPGHGGVVHARRDRGCAWHSGHRMGGHSRDRGGRLRSGPGLSRSAPGSRAAILVVLLVHGGCSAVAAWWSRRVRSGAPSARAKAAEPGRILAGGWLVLLLLGVAATSEPVGAVLPDSTFLGLFVVAAISTVTGAGYTKYVEAKEGLTAPPEPDALDRRAADVRRAAGRSRQWLCACREWFKRAPSAPAGSDLPPPRHHLARTRGRGTRQVGMTPIRRSRRSESLIARQCGQEGSMKRWL